MKIIILLLILIFSSTVYAELKYEQDVTITSFISFEDVKQKANAFCNAAKGDKDILVVGINYKNRKDIHAYDAVITCYVSEVDRDLMRIQAQVYANKGK